MSKKALIACALSLLASAFGGWTSALTTLCIFMCIDWISGVVLAAVFHKSTKTKNGCLESRAGIKGICKKVFELALVVVAAQIDMITGLTCVRDAVVILLVINEAISIIENIGLMGVPIPAPLREAIEVLKQKGRS